jgi:antitoxin PrlF
VVLSRSGGSEDEDPALGAFLNFLANDMAQQPQRLQAVDAGLVQHLQALVGQVKVDLDTALPLDDE